MQDHDDEDNNHDHENDDSDDERQLATLVLLLLRPPIPPKRTGDGNNDNAGENHPSTNNAGAQDGDEGAADAMTENTMTSSPPSTVQPELEKDECRLLCFVGRLIHGYRAAYTAAATATRTVSPWPTNQLSPPDEGRSHCKEDAPSTNPSICFIQSAYLKLAVRILYLRYHDPHSDYYHDKNDDRAAADEVRTHEECLFLILLRAFQTRCDRNAELEQVDVEMAWTLHGLLLRFFRRLLTNKEEDDCAVSSSLNNHRDDDEDDSRELQSNNSSFWVSLIDSLLTRRRRQRLRSGEGMVQMTTAESVEAVEKVASRKARMNRDDSETQQQQQTGEKVDDPTMAMAQTLHSIVDHHSHRVLGVPLDAMPTMASMSVSTATAIATANDDSQIDANNHKAEQNVDRENPTKECLETKRRHYWDDQFDRTIVTCLQSFLRVCSSSSTGSHPSCSDESCWLLSRQSLLELILWSQARLVYGSDGDGEEEGKSQRSSSQYSLDIYHFTLQYLRQCCRLCYQNRHVITGPPTTLTSSSSSSSTNDPCRSLYEMCVARDCNRVNDVDASYPLNTDRSQITEAAHAIRSFVFYGVIVLSNEHAGPRSVQLENLAEGNVKEGNGTKAYNSPFRDANLLRWEIHELILELWQSIGPEWLYASPNSTQLCSSTSTTTLDDEPSFWWFSSTSFDQTPFAASRRKKGQSGHGHDNPQKLGKTWPLCLLIRLAAGEFRLQLGRWVDCSHSKNNDEKSVGGDNEGRDYELFEEDVSSTSYPNHSTIINTIESHARIVVQSVHLMMSLAGEENEVSDAMVTDEKDPQVWTANSILHVRNSLEDALDSSIQYFVMVSDDLGSGMVPTKDVNSPDLERIIRTCSMVLGTIASELELDYLLSISVSCKNSDGTYNKMIGPENVNDETTEFAIALRSALSFCHDLGKNRISQQFEEMNAASRWEEYEPMVYLLPCIMSLTTTIASDQEDTNEETTGKALATLTFLSKDCFLVHLISSFLHRMLEYWKNFIIHRDEGKIDNDSILSSRANTTLSLVRMCAALTEMLVISGSWIVSKHEIRVLHDSLQAWRKELAARSQQKLISLVDLRDDIESTMVHISDIQTIFH